LVRTPHCFVCLHLSRVRLSNGNMVPVTAKRVFQCPNPENSPPRWAYPEQGRSYRANGAPISVDGLPPCTVGQLQIEPPHRKLKWSWTAHGGVADMRWLVRWLGEAHGRPLLTPTSPVVMRALCLSVSCLFLVVAQKAFTKSPELPDLDHGFHSDIDETSLASGDQHTCAIEDSGREIGGKAVCWGANSHGQATPPAVRVPVH
jgi:hypothetical protein